MSPQKVALLVIDVQKAIDDPRWGRRGQPEMEENIARLLGVWRSRGLPIVHVRHDSQSPGSTYAPGQPLHAFKDEVKPLPDELIVAKTVHSAFLKTSMNAHLEALGAKRIVITGVLLENSVDATVRVAANLGYEVIVPKDAVASTDRTDANGKHWSTEDVHALMLALLDGEYATVTTTEALIATLEE